MASLTYISPKSILSKIFDAFNPRNPENTEALAPTQEAMKPRKASKPKLNISVQDLKTISTALLYFKRHLKKIGEQEKAEGIAEIDQRFFDLITFLEEHQQEKAVTKERSLEKEEKETAPEKMAA